MIRNGFYYPVELFNDLTDIDPESGEVIGHAVIGVAFGNRTAGKTVGVGITLVKRYLESGRRCMLLARTEEDIKGGYLEKWWRNKVLGIKDADGIIPDFVNKHEITFTQKTMFVDKKPFCYCEAITASSKVKNDGNYSYCTDIVMDEAVQPGERFLLWKGRTYMERIFEIWQTVARGWEKAESCTHIIFIANISETDNWVFNDLGINKFVRPDTKMTCQNGIHVDIVMNKEAKRKVDESLMGLVMSNSVSGRVYNASAQGNETRDNKSFIKPCGLDFKNIVVQFAVRNFFIGIFRTKDGYHAARIEKDSRSRIFCNRVDLHSEDIEYQLDGEWEKIMREIYLSGKMTFQTQEDKGLFLEYCHIM